MQISKRTLGILKNFASINQSILIEEGNTIETISNIKDVYAKVEVDETFPVTFAIYDLNEFLACLSLFTKPELTFEEGFEKHIVLVLSLIHI